VGLQVHLENDQRVLIFFPLFAESGHLCSQAGQLGVDLLTDPLCDLVAPPARARQRSDPGLLALFLHLRQLAVECLLFFRQGRVPLIIRIQDIELCLEIGDLLFHAGQIGLRTVVTPHLVRHLGLFVFAGVVLDPVGVHQVINLLGPGRTCKDQE
jgi:hypothetical protein